MGRRQTVTPAECRKVFKEWGLEHKGTRGSHERWSKPGMTRPAILDNKHKTVPEFHLRNNVKAIGRTLADFFKTLDAL